MAGTGMIDTRFDTRSDAGGRDPDSHSKTLRRYHQLLWSKPLPSGALFDLDAKRDAVGRTAQTQVDDGRRRRAAPKLPEMARGPGPTGVTRTVRRDEDGGMSAPIDPVYLPFDEATLRGAFRQGEG